MIRVYTKRAVNKAIETMKKLEKGGRYMNKIRHFTLNGDPRGSTCSR